MFEKLNRSEVVQLESALSIFRTKRKLNKYSIRILDSYARKIFATLDLSIKKNKDIVLKAYKKIDEKIKQPKMNDSSLSKEEQKTINDFKDLVYLRTRNLNKYNRDQIYNVISDLLLNMYNPAVRIKSLIKSIAGKL